MLEFSYKKHILEFNFDARTSRGAIKQHTACYIIVKDKIKNITGYGEASPLQGLSLDATGDFEIKLHNILQLLNEGEPIENLDISGLPSAAFGIETALLDLKHGGKRIVFENDFVLGKPIPINGLVWMADAETMYAQAIEKINAGFNCIKIKVGSLDFDEECRLLEKIRKKHNPFAVELRLDANGAFATDEVFEKLKDLSRFDIHSIEQPIKPGLPDFLEEVCSKSKIPVALDEELIGVGSNQKEKLLKAAKPAYIILKPTLIGGFKQADEWIQAAQKFNIGWWATSALESNIGLNAIAQWVFSKNNPLHQGLGTGSLYKNNIKSPLLVENGKLRYNQKQKWEIEF